MSILTSSIFLWAAFLSCIVVVTGAFAARNVGVGVALSLLLMIGLYASSGTPRPMLQSWLSPLPNTEPVPVLAYTLKEGVAIYVWLGYAEPLAVALPWDRRLAGELQEEWEESEGNVMLLWPIEPSLDPQEKLFHGMPLPALPPKPAPVEGPQVYEQPA